MEILFENRTSSQVPVSIILLDWSVRHSYHILDYLRDQTAARDRYEVIWIEYYAQKALGIEKKIKDSIANGRPAPLNIWVMMEMPRNIYYHKHLMYNIGIIISSGRIITFCDSDAVVKPTFIESIIDSFEREEDIVLHMDEVRNVDKRLYPFSYPSIERIEGKGCINMMGGKPMGLVDENDPLHIRNYGACMSALRKDLIAIGGADEHIDYLGNICGPYDMTFRLRNYGKKEVWHKGEWLYHIWHPGQFGAGNYKGPHDGRDMSKVALNALISKWIEPLAENPAIRFLRLGKECNRDGLLSIAIPEQEILEGWRLDIIKKRLFALANFRHYPFTYIKIFPIFLKTFLTQLLSLFEFHIVNNSIFTAGRTLIGKSNETKENRFILIRFLILILKIIRRIYWRIRFIYRYNKAIIENCWHLFYNRLIPDGTRELALFGISDIVKIVLILAKQTGIKIVGIYDNVDGLTFEGHKVAHYTNLKDYKDKILISTSINTEERMGRLKRLGIKEENILLP